VLNTHTYIHKSFLYSAYKFDRVRDRLQQTTTVHNCTFTRLTTNYTAEIITIQFDVTNYVIMSDLVINQYKFYQFTQPHTQSQHKYRISVNSNVSENGEDKKRNK